MDNRFYTYAYLNNANRPYYIGKGCGKRAYLNHGSLPVPSPDRILILKKGLSECQAIKHEQYMISVLGKKSDNTGILENILDKGQVGSVTYEVQDPCNWGCDLLFCLLGNKTAACVLLFINKYGEAHASQIAKSFRFGLNMTQRQLKKLENEYILVSRKVGNLRVYYFNFRNPVVKSFQTFLSSYQELSTS